MKTLYMMRGLPASGKSTRAKEMLQEFGAGNAKRVNKDDLRAMIDDGKWSGKNEAFVLSIRDFIIKSALADGKHALVDDTNLSPKHEARLRQLARESEAAFELVDFCHVSVDECIARDRKRASYVGEKVIRGMHDQFLRPTPPVVADDPDLPGCLLVDVDGTIARMNGRGPFDWDRVEEDVPRFKVWDAIEALADKLSAQIILMSGRDEASRAGTYGWLRKHFGFSLPLYMRPAGDMRKDCIVKRELFETHIAGKYNVRAIFDDRPQVLRLWREMGYGDRLFDVGEGVEF